MKLILFQDDKIIKQLFENVTNVNFDSLNLTFDSNSTIYNLVGLNSNYAEIDDTSTLLVGDSVTDADVLNFVKSKKHIEIVNGYSSDLVKNVTSSIVWTDGRNLVFGYSPNDQLNYSKRANTLALDSTITSFIIGTKSHGAITITRSDYITWMSDGTNHEMTLYDKLDNLRTQIDNSTDVATVNAITW